MMRPGKQLPLKLVKIAQRSINSKKKIKTNQTKPINLVLLFDSIQKKNSKTWFCYIFFLSKPNRLN